MQAAELTDIPLLAELSDEDRVALAERMHELEVSAGSYVVQQGELSYKFYVILEGTAALDRRESISLISGRVTSSGKWASSVILGAMPTSLPLHRCGWRFWWAGTSGR